MAASIRLAPETEQRLDYLASHTGRTKAYYLREIIKHGIEEMEDYCPAADAREFGLPLDRQIMVMLDPDTKKKARRLRPRACKSQRKRKPVNKNQSPLNRRYYRGKGAETP